MSASSSILSTTPRFMRPPHVQRHCFITHSLSVKCLKHRMHADSWYFPSWGNSPTFMTGPRPSCLNIAFSSSSNVISSIRNLLNSRASLLGQGLWASLLVKNVSLCSSLMRSARSVSALRPSSTKLIYCAISP